MNRWSLLVLVFALSCTMSLVVSDFSFAQTTPASGNSGVNVPNSAYAGYTGESSTTPPADSGQSYQHLQRPQSPPQGKGGGDGGKCPSPYGGSKASNTADENIARESNSTCHTSGSANYFKGIPPGASCMMGMKSMKNLDNLDCDAPGGFKGKCSAKTHTCKATNPSGQPNPSGVSGGKGTSQAPATSTASTTGMMVAPGFSPLNIPSTTTPDFSQTDGIPDANTPANADVTSPGSPQTDTPRAITPAYFWVGVGAWNGWYGASASTPGKAYQIKTTNTPDTGGVPTDVGQPQTNNANNAGNSGSQFQEGVAFDPWVSIFSAPNDIQQTAPADSSGNGPTEINPAEYSASASFTDDSYLTRHPIQPSIMQRIYDSVKQIMTDTLHL